MNNVLVNGLLLNSQFSGVHYYIENLFSAMRVDKQRQVRVDLLTSEMYSGRIGLNEGVRMVPSGVDTRNRCRRVCYENLYMVNFLRLNGYGLYHSPNYILPYFLSVPSVVTVHDLIALEFPSLCETASVVYHRFFQRNSILKASKVIAVSNIVKQKIIEMFKVPEEKIEVIYNGVKMQYFEPCSLERRLKVKQQLGLPDRYLLFVGNIEPKKNLVRLIEAFNHLKHHCIIPHKLVIAGKKGWKYAEVFSKISQLNLHDDVLMLGYVEETLLPAVYGLSDLFVFPSLYEGFGIPILEAMACGIPVVISNSGAIPEITGNRFEMARADDVQDISSKIYKGLFDLDYREKAVIWGKERAKSFLWQEAAERTLNVYCAVIGQI